MTRTKSQKARAKAAQLLHAQMMLASQMQHQPVKSSKGKKWHLAVNTPWGAGSLGSADAPPKELLAKPRARARGVRTIDLNGGADRTQWSTLTQEVAQDEPIGVLNGSTSFSSQSFSIQPGLKDVFPWMEGFGNKYEFYRFKHLEFYYKPMVSSFATQGQSGKVIMSADYDSASGDLQDYRQAETMNPHSDCMPHQSMSLVLDPARLTPKEGKYLRTGPPPAGTDVKTYDAGRLHFCTVGQVDSTAIGELRVRYIVELLNPRLPNTLPAPPNYTWSQFYEAGVAIVTANQVQALPYGTTLGNGLGITQPTPGVFRVAAGTYRIAARGVFQYDVAPVVATNITSLKLYKNGVAVPSSLAATSIAAGTTYATNQFDYILSCNDGDTFSIEAAAGFAGGTNVYVQGSLAVTLA
jgi:hypothetical protein